MWELFFPRISFAKAGQPNRGEFREASFAAFAASVAFVIGLVCTVQALGRGELSKYFRGPYLRGASLRLKGIDRRLEAPQCAPSGVSGSCRA